MRLIVDVRKAFDSGIGTYIQQLLPRVIDALPQARVQALTLRGQADLHTYLTKFDVAFVETAAKSLSLQEQWKLRRLMQAGGIFWATSLAHPLFSAKPMINTVHDVAQLALPSNLGNPTSTRLLSRPFFESIRRCSDQIIFVSDFTAREFIRLVGTPRSPCVTIPQGVDESWFTPVDTRLPRAIPEPYFVMIGTLRPYKNLSLVLSAMESISARLPHRLLLIGPDHAQQAIAATVPAHLSNRVAFAGHLPLPALRAALHHAEALLFPSHYEGFGLPVLESMACGCPVLVARNGISAQIAGPFALNFDPDNSDELADAMITQAEYAPATREVAIREGTRRARLNPWDLTAARTVEVLEQVWRRTAMHTSAKARS